VDEKTTFLFPITDYASQINGIMMPAMDNVLTGKKPPESLTEANNQVNQLFGWAVREGRPSALGPVAALTASGPT
jgi:hypothetical protein